MAASSHTRPAREAPPPQEILAEGASGASIDPADVARFSAQAAEWWDAKGPFAPLHKFNPARLAFVRDPRHWGMAFRRSLFEVGDGDFALIAGAMGLAEAVERLRG